MTMTLDNPPAPAAAPSDAPAPKRLVLWPNGLPGSTVPSNDPADTPTLTLFQPSPKIATGASIVLCPGGGYSQHSSFECDPVAQWLTRLGITALLLRYRHGPRHLHPAPLQDAARAVKMARALAAPWKLDPNRVGVLGFSAGGHLASTLSTRFSDGDKASPDPVDRFSSRPDLAVLIYPVITLQDPHTNAHSRKHLLGDSPSAEQLDHLSNHKQVTKRTPPTFLFHTLDDGPVPPENSLLYFTALRAAGVPAEMHLYEKGVHGVGLAEKDPHLNTWPTLVSRWLATRGFGNGA